MRSIKRRSIALPNKMADIFFFSLYCLQGLLKGLVLICGLF